MFKKNMVLKRLLFLLITFTLSLHASGMSCALPLQPYAYIENVKYQMLRDNKIHIAEVADPKTTLSIGFFESGHSMIFYDGYRIDSLGSAGRQVTAILKHNTHFNGDILVVIDNLPTEIINQLNSLIEDFKTESDRTCVGVTCKYLINLNIGAISRKVLTPQSLLQNLIDYKKKAPNQIRIFTLKSKKINDVIKKMRIRTFTAVAFLSFVGSSALLPILGTLTYLFW